MTATRTRNRRSASRFVAHVHPETHDPRDPREVRLLSLHRKRAECALSDCTFEDLTPAARKMVIEEANALLAAPPAPARKAKPASERRNETTHPDGAAAVAAVGCSACKARKGAKCIRHDGERTNHVHAARMRAWEAKGGAK